MPTTGATAAPAARAAHGRAARKRASRSSHGVWIPGADRPDPVAVLERQGRDRLPELLPIRYGRMTASPFAFLRGAAAVMAADLASQPHTGLTVQLCGDAHLLNFGLFASPERALHFDLNDFDETHPGPFEWDVKRLAASVAVAARENGYAETRVRRAAEAAAAGYRKGVRRLADRGELAVWYERVDADRLLPLVRSAGRRRRVESSLTRARRRTSLHALGKLTETVDGRRRIVRDPRCWNRPVPPTWRPCARSSATTVRPSPRSAASCWTATASWTRPARSSESAASAPAASSCCSPDGTRTTRCSCRSRRPPVPFWRSICPAARTSIPATGSSPDSGCCSRRATSSSAG